MKKIMIMLVLGALAFATQADILASWDFDGNTTTPTSFAADYLNIGLGVTSSSVDDPTDTLWININRTDAITWRNLNDSTTEATALSKPTYIEFKIAASSAISLTSLDLRISNWADPTASTMSYFLRSSTDSYASNVSTTYDISSNTLDPDVTAMAISGVSGTDITLRLYGYASAGAPADFGPYLGIGSTTATGVNDIAIQGSVVPEPATALLLGVGGLFSLMIRRIKG